MAHVLLFPSEMKTKTGGRGRLVLSLGEMMGFLHSVSRLDMFCEAITLDDMLVCANAAGQKKVWGEFTYRFII